MTMFVPQADKDGHIPAVHTSWIEPLSPSLADPAFIASSVEDRPTEGKTAVPVGQLSKVP